MPQNFDQYERHQLKVHHHSYPQYVANVHQVLYIDNWNDGMSKL